MKYDAFSKYHPLVNFLFFIGAIGFGVVIQHPAYLLVGALCALFYYLLLQGRRGMKMVLLLIPVFLFFSLVNPIFNTLGKTELFLLFGRPYTLEALYHGMAVSGILVVMLLWFGCYNRVMTSDKFISLFGSRIPALSLLLVMVFRMVPNLIRKAFQLTGARQAIGKGVSKNSTSKEKLHNGMTILSALTDQALEGGIVTGDSMRTRGYGCAKPTSFSLYRFTCRDLGMTMLMALFMVAAVILGGMGAEYTPALVIDRPTWGLAAYAAYLLIPTILHIKEAIQWHISISRI